MDAFEVRGVGALQAYLRQAVMNRLRDELRRKGRAPAFVDVKELDVAGQGSPLEEAIGAEAAARYVAARYHRRSRSHRTEIPYPRSARPYPPPAFQLLARFPQSPGGSKGLAESAALVT
jgi:hypothetical protein